MSAGVWNGGQLGPTAPEKAWGPSLEEVLKARRPREATTMCLMCRRGASWLPPALSHLTPLQPQQLRKDHPDSWEEAEAQRWSKEPEATQPIAAVWLQSPTFSA